MCDNMPERPGPSQIPEDPQTGARNDFEEVRFRRPKLDPELAPELAPFISTHPSGAQMMQRPGLGFKQIPFGFLC